MDGNDDLEQYSRIPTLDDLVTLCRNLNVHDVKYVTLDILVDEMQGVRMPYLKPELLIKTKLGVRPKDVQDRAYLQRLTKAGKKP